VKVASTPETSRSLSPAITFHQSVHHPTIVSPIDVDDSADRRRLTYPWVDGVVLNHATVAGSDRAGLRRFHRLPIDEVLAALHTVFDAHRAVASAGFVSIACTTGASCMTSTARSCT